MTHRFCRATALALITIALLGCGQPETTTETAPAAETNAATPAATETGEVAFEPAYPEDVSAEPLTAADTAQQQTHQHRDGEAHAHDEETKTDHGHPH